MGGLPYFLLNFWHVNTAWHQLEQVANWLKNETSQQLIHIISDSFLASSLLRQETEGGRTVINVKSLKESSLLKMKWSFSPRMEQLI